MAHIRISVCIHESKRIFEYGHLSNLKERYWHIAQYAAIMFVHYVNGHDPKYLL